MINFLIDLSFAGVVAGTILSFAVLLTKNLKNRRL